LPVYRGTVEDMVGYVHSRDLLLERRRADGHLARVLRPLVLVPDSLRVDRLLPQLREQHAQLAVVTDEFGGVAGLVTIGDVLTDVMGALPNEFATEGTAERLPDGRLRVAALTRVGEGEPWLVAAWPGRAGTVGGRLVERLGRVPKAGEHLVVNGITLDVESATPRAVRSILVTPPGGPAK
jgi:CBS domain containing-hemolysin-like protein